MDTYNNVVAIDESALLDVVHVGATDDGDGFAGEICGKFAVKFRLDLFEVDDWFHWSVIPAWIGESVMWLGSIHLPKLLNSDCILSSTVTRGL